MPNFEWLECSSWICSQYKSPWLRASTQAMASASKSKLYWGYTDNIVKQNSTYFYVRQYCLNWSFFNWKWASCSTRTWSVENDCPTSQRCNGDSMIMPWFECRGSREFPARSWCFLWSVGWDYPPWRDYKLYSYGGCWALPLLYQAT